MRRPRRIAQLVLALAAWGMIGAIYVSGHWGRTGQLPFLHRESVWSIAIYEGPSPFELAPTSADNRPALTATDVTDVPALFVADPFMVQHLGQWFLFMEVLNASTHQGDIGVATSKDGRSWNYQQIVLDEPFHLSYPFVFHWEDRWYMLPESSETGSVRLYEAASFPRGWKQVKTLVRSAQPADPTLFRFHDTWWMFVGTAATHDQLRLYFADDLCGDWHEHPLNPLITDNPDIARPGGSVVHFDGQLYRFGQDCRPKYGNQLRAFRITKLSKTEYAEEPIEPNPVLTAGVHTWNAQGMHHSNPHLLPSGQWRAAVDGHRKAWILQTTP